MPWIARREVVEPDGFADVTVRAQFVGAQDVGVGGRGGQDDHRDAAQVLVGVDRGEHFSAVGAGQVQVEQDEVRSRCGGVPAPAVQERQRGLAVTHDVHPVLGAAFAQRVQVIAASDGLSSTSRMSGREVTGGAVCSSGSVVMVACPARRAG